MKKINFDFWDGVLDCSHDNLSDYSKMITCWTPYCSGNEYHCLDCGAYISECRCGCESGMSGWPEKRWNTYHSRKRKSLDRERRD